MGAKRRRSGRAVWFFLLSAAICLAAGTAGATCVVESVSPGEVPCYIVVQPIDVCSNTGTLCAPFNTTSTNGVGSPSTQNQSTNPIGFWVDPATGVANPSSGGVDITRTLLNQIGVDVTWKPIAQYNSPINPATGTTFQTLNVAQTTNSAGATILQSQDFLTLSYQPQISQGTATTSPNTVFPNAPLGTPSTVINLFFVNKLNPPTQQAGGTLYGFSWIGNNGVAIAADTFGYPRSRTSLPPRPDTIAHELLHNLGLDHTTFGAGPYNPAGISGSPPGGIVPPIPANPLSLECDPSYPACGANLMTAGNLRTEPTVGCVLSSSETPLSTCVTSAGAPLPTLMNGMADQVNTPSTSAETGADLPVSQQAEVLTGGSGLLSSLNTGLLNPIPHATTRAQAGTGGGSAAPVVFDVSGLTGGKPGETLVAWVLTLPQGSTFAGYGRFHIVSQSREHLVQSVDDYPNADNGSVVWRVAYDPGADRYTAASGACTDATAKCLMIAFAPPGLGTHDSIRFSKGIRDGRAAITNNDLCRAKITYIFSDGYMTTSDLGRCPATSLPLIASSWRPDPTVPARIVDTRLFLADDIITGSLPCTPVAGSNPPRCADPTQTGLADADPRQEGGQPGQSCNNGAVSGTITGNVTVSAGQYCRYTSPCEIQGNLTIDGGSVYLGCTVDGNLTENSGILVLAPSASVAGNVRISEASAFTIGPGVAIDGNLQIQSLPGGLPQRGTVCGTRIRGNLVAQNNASPLEIGGSICGGDTISGNLQVNGNSATTDVSFNTVTGNLQCQNNADLTSASNTVRGQAQGQCAP